MPTLRGVSKATNGATVTTSVTCPLPDGVQAGDWFFPGAPLPGASVHRAPSQPPCGLGCLRSAKSFDKLLA